jgi:glutamate carboxypeptidase
VSPETLAGELRRWVDRHAEHVLSDLHDLVAVDAPSGHVELLAQTEQLLEQRAVRAGGRITKHPHDAGTHLEIRFGVDGPAPIVILGHYDTVWPEGTAAERPLTVGEDVIHGPGVFDMRGGVVAALNAVAALTELDAQSRPVVLLLTADEETGSRTSEELIVRTGDAAHVVLIPEPPLADGGLKTQRKGVLTFRVRIEGRAAHAGLDPERGISAIHELASLVMRVRTLEDRARGTTVNVGVVAGGSRSNVVAADAVADIDVRVATLEQYEAVEGWFDSIVPELVGASVRVERLNARPPLERTPAVAAAADRTRAAARLLGLELGEGSAGGGSDGNFLACRGVAVVDGLGPVGGGAHALDEHIRVESLLDRTALLALLAATL